MKIIELKIDENLDLSGVDGVALVNQPAIEEEWYYFNRDNKYRVLEEEEGIELAKKLNELGIPAEVINEDEEWVVVGVKPINTKDDLTEKKDLFSTNIISNPNAESEWDTIDSNTGTEYRIRYKYSGPQDSKNRTFCKDLMQANRIFRREDIDAMTQAGANSEFGNYDIFSLRGSYNCRHQWVELKYKKEGRILNKASVKRGVVGQEKIGSADDTKTNAYLNNKEKKKGVFSQVYEIDGEPVFTTKEEALAVSLMKGCEGYHEHLLPNGEVGFMACKEHPEVFKQQFSFDEEKRMIYAPAMIPGKFIIRRNFMGELYYVFFSKETIKQISQKYLKNKYIDKTNIEHTPINLDGVYVVESWIIEDKDHDKANKFGFNLEEGTWMLGLKVENDQVWENVKNGKLRGLSVEGYFTEHLLFNKGEGNINIKNKK